ncbi:hypothetical protein [Fimbriiglobus ruber]|uniref:Tetratricopeptide repeat protein n=1 Tax=Fimbriiglobus ruber TaxID=1908690 RepID=A0A225DZE3_9BACT|nr:hypothetical protein [Fimbriiglobus ruber]OWK46672.1 hypothetical protein FRUB_00371 [Fimbriiglobus ruber]
MSDHHDQMQELLDRAAEVDRGPTQIALIEEAVRIADAHQDAEAGFVARKRLTEAAAFGGQPDVELVSFSWCLAQVDRDPQNFDESELLWSYKWVVGNLSNFPNISRGQIEDLFADMARRFERHGSTLHAVHGIRREVAVDMLDRETAEAAHAKFLKVARDRLSDCAACVQDTLIDYYAFLGRDEDAITAARPILDGKMTCGEVPHRTYAKVLMPLFRLGKLERAARYYKLGYKMIRPNPKFVAHKAYHLTFLTLTDNLDRATVLFERHLGEAIRSTSALWKFEFYAAARLFLEIVARGKATPLLGVPEELRVDGQRDRPAGELFSWFDAQLTELAAAFDARNGNNGFAKHVAGIPALARTMSPFPIS